MPPYSQRSRPGHCAGRIAAVDPFDAHRETALVALNDGTSVRKTLDGLHELITMPSLGRIEVKRAGMTEIAFRNQVCKHQYLVTRPLPAPLNRHGARRSHMITDT